MSPILCRCGRPRAGKGSLCNPCNAEKRRIYYRKNRELVLSINRKWAITDSGKAKKRAADKRYREENKERTAANFSRYYEKNAERIISKGRRYRSENRDALLRQHREWCKKNRELCNLLSDAYRARKLNAAINDLTVQQWEEIKRRFDFKCAYCGTFEAALTKDHVTPLSRGGNHTASNIVPACRSCNCSKKARTADEFKVKRG